MTAILSRQAVPIALALVVATYLGALGAIRHLRHQSAMVDLHIQAERLAEAESRQRQLLALRQANIARLRADGRIHEVAEFATIREDFQAKLAGILAGVAFEVRIAELRPEARNAIIVVTRATISARLDAAMLHDTLRQIEAMRPGLMIERMSAQRLVQPGLPPQAQRGAAIVDLLIEGQVLVERPAGRRTP